ncbi:MAG: DUF3048 domain-containing protein [Chloroflexi bacterium]|nr:DUF3048 domain-containing protein [Chloroflexota bacterium]
MYRSSSTRYALIAAGLAVLVTLATLAAACSSPAQATPTPTRTPRPAVTVAPPTQPSATAMPSPTRPPTVAPTATPIPPTATAAPTAAPTGASYTRPANVNPLTGLPVADPKLLARRPLMVVINNDPEARPVHYGFGQADLVYEYIMEGRAVTRYTAVFLGNESERIGPVRSARLVNFYLTPQYDGTLVASGAGKDVRWWLRDKMMGEMGLPYLDEGLDDQSDNLYFWSLGGLAQYRTRLQTSTAGIRRWLASLKREQDPKLRGFAFAETIPTGSPGKTASISFPAAVVWSYDASSGRYVRSLAGTAHIDAASGKQLSAANVIIQTVSHEKTDYVEDDTGTTSIRIITVGEGPVTILRDGVAIKGTWKAGDTSMPEFFNAAGKPIPLKPGTSWFELVAATDTVTVN